MLDARIPDLDGVIPATADDVGLVVGIELEREHTVAVAGSDVGQSTHYIIFSVHTALKTHTRQKEQRFLSWWLHHTIGSISFRFLLAVCFWHNIP